MHSIRFPYAQLRSGQQEISESVIEHIDRGGTLLVEAPSGFGKTAAIIAGISSIATSKTHKVYYVCRTKREIARVMEEMHKFLEFSPINFSFIIPRFELCLKRHEEPKPITPEVFKSYCDFQIANRLCNYFETTFNYTERELGKGITVNASSPLKVLGWLKERKVCPYEALNLVAENSRVLLCTYSYFLQNMLRQIAYPGIELSRPIQSQKLIGVFDEAHNLPDLLSSQLNLRIAYSQLRAASINAKEIGADLLSDTLNRFSTALTEVWAQRETNAITTCSELLEYFFSQVTRTELFAAIQQLNLALERIWLGMWQRQYDLQRFADLMKINEIISFLFSADSLDVGAGIMVTRVGSMADPAVSMEVADSSYIFPKIAARFHCQIFLSATIEPRELFVRQLGLEVERTHFYRVEAASTPNILILVDRGISSRLRQRSEILFTRMAERVAAFAEGTPGGVGVFASSYPVLAGLVAHLPKALGKRRLFIERQGMELLEAASVAEDFKAAARGDSAVLLGVQGGRFSEGQHFDELEMKGVAVVGLALPRPTKEYFTRMRFARRIYGSDAYTVLSLLPAVRRAIQAAGRAARGPDRHAAVYFADDRFAEQRVRRLFPSWLKSIEVDDFEPMRLLTRLTNFHKQTSSHS